MQYTYILDDSIKSLTLILTADHSTLLFLPTFYQIKNFLFLLWVNLYMITGIYLHDPPPFNGPFFITPPFSESQKVVTLPLFPPPFPPANFWQVPWYITCIQDAIKKHSWTVLLEIFADRFLLMKDTTQESPLENLTFLESAVQHKVMQFGFSF